MNQVKGESRQLFEWVKASVELPEVEGLPIIISYGSHRHPFISIFYNKRFVVSDVNDFGKEDYKNVEWLKPIQSSLKEETEYEWAKFKDDFLVMCDRYLRDRGASNTDTHECISLALEDFKSSLTPKSISDIPSTEDVKRWFQLLVGKGEKAMREDMEASLKPNKLSDSEIEKMAEAEVNEFWTDGGMKLGKEELKDFFIAGSKAIIELNKK